MVSACDLHIYGRHERRSRVWRFLCLRSRASERAEERDRREKQKILFRSIVVLGS